MTWCLSPWLVFPFLSSSYSNLFSFRSIDALQQYGLFNSFSSSPCQVVSMLLQSSYNSQFWPCLPPMHCLKSRFLARHLDHVSLSCWAISLVPPFPRQSPRVRIPVEDLLSMTTRHRLPSLTTPEHLWLHDLCLWTWCIKEATGEHIRD